MTVLPDETAPRAPSPRVEAARATAARLAGAVGGRGTAALLAAGAIVVACALLSHSAEDASFWNATGLPPRNWMGGFGANLSCAFYAAFGVAAWALPLGAATWAWRLWRGRVRHGTLGAARIAGCGAGALVALPAFLSALPGKMAGGTGFGGLIGDRAILPFARIFDRLGFDAPYQVPGLAMAVLGLVALGAALGCTRGEAARIGRRGWSDLRRATSRERRRRVSDAVAGRARALSDHLRARRARPVTPVLLRGADLPTEQDRPTLAAEEPRGELAPKRVSRPSEAKEEATRAPKPKPRRRPSGKAGSAPPIDLLARAERPPRRSTPAELKVGSDALAKVLHDYGVKGEIVSAKEGPVITLHELEPVAGTKAARVVSLSDDIARSMSALSARVAPVKGRTVIGIELPNEHRETVHLREIMEELVRFDAPLPLALGKEIDGRTKIASLAKMPHLLVAGTTGAGKSVAINAMILSLVYRHPPSECRMIMIDPKILELSVYDGIPHLLSPVVTDPKKAVMALKWTVREMDQRYERLARMNVRNLDGYNARMREMAAAGEVLRREVIDEDGTIRIEESAPETLPYIVVVVDEMADLMMVAGKEIEHCIQRLAQKARASGIHIIMATQRPSVDVITGTIKANFPTRISFQVTSKIDSRTILGEQGAEALLGQGDMLLMSPGKGTTRVHGPFVSDDEVQRIADDLRAQGAAEDLVTFDEPGGDGGDGAFDGMGGADDEEASLYDRAVAIVASDRKASISYIQRKLQIGYNRAARIMEQMEQQGVITPANNAGKREILIEAR